MADSNNIVNEDQDILCSCKLCRENFDYSDRLGKFSSTITGTIFDVGIRNDEDLPPCKLSCVIYLITCSKCKIQYVGKTKQQLKCRVNGHRQSCKNKNEQIIYKHFNSDCKFENAKFRIIERTEEANLLSREDYWIKKLMSLYPFGLNDQISEIGNMTRQNLVNFNFVDPFFRYPEIRRPRGHGIRNNKISNINYNLDLIINNLKLIYNQHGLKKFVDTLKGTSKKLLTNILHKILPISNQFERRFVDIISAYIGHCRRYSNESKSNNRYNKIRVKLDYSSKILDTINVQSIISSAAVKSKIPIEYEDHKVEIIYKYNKPIGNIICNYNMFLDSLSKEDIMENSPCICERDNSHLKVREFIYSPVGHVVTGNIDILDKLDNFNELKKVVKYGYKYRLQDRYVTWQKIKRDVMRLVENLKSKIVSKNKGNDNDLNDWEETVKQRINNRIRSLQNSKNLKDFENGINYNLLDKQINNIHKNFVITTVDKASNNFAFICKKFYLSMIKNELGITNNRVEGNGVYSYCENYSVQDIVDSECERLERFHGEVKANNRKIPKLFMNPKFHKRPYKYRFIAGASKAISKELSIDVNLCLKLVKKAHKGYCKTIYSRTGYNYFWSVDNSKEVIDKLNHVVNPSSIHTYDFSTLYTNLPLELVRDELFEMIDRYFDINEPKNNKYIIVDHFNHSSWFSSTKGKKGAYDRHNLKIALEYLLFNSYVRFGPYVFKQVKGIPMGGNASPLIADLFLCNLEFKYMRRLVDSKCPGNIRLVKSSVIIADI